MAIFNKSKIKKALYSSGAQRLLRRLSSYLPRILMYHRFAKDIGEHGVMKENFEKQLVEIRKKFNPITLDDLHKSLSGEIPLIKNSVILTIDDGYADFYDLAYPLLKKYGMPATIYITHDFIEQKTWLWPDLIEYVLQTTKNNFCVLELNGESKNYPLASETDKSAVWQILINYLTAVDNEHKWHFIKELFKQLQLDFPDKVPDAYKPLNWEQIKELSENNINIGAHTCSHPILSQLNSEGMQDEILGSKIKIEKVLGTEVDHFCYPNGTVNDYNFETKEIVKQSGFKTATVAFHDKNVIDDPYELRRYAVDNNLNIFREAIYGFSYLSDKYLN